MAIPRKPPRSEAAVQDFLGSAHMFTSSIEQIIERKLLQEINGSRLSHAQFRLLKMVALTEAQTIRDVALFLKVSNAAASKSVDKLVRQKLLKRDEAEDDRREIRLSLTDTARKLLEAYDQARDARLNEVFGLFSESELSNVSHVLDRLTAALIAQSGVADQVCLQCGIYLRENCLVRRFVKRNCFYHGRRKALGEK